MGLLHILGRLCISGSLLKMQWTDSGAPNTFSNMKNKNKPKQTRKLSAVRDAPLLFPSLRICRRRRRRTLPPDERLDSSN